MLCNLAHCEKPARWLVRDGNMLIPMCTRDMELGLDHHVFTEEQCTSIPGVKAG
jgi:hypothetical protein